MFLISFIKKKILAKSAKNNFFKGRPEVLSCFHLKNKVLHDECRFSIESIYTLENLLNEKRANKEDAVLRFLVDRFGVAWFARETRPHVKAPKHFQMTGETQEEVTCLSAGNLKFTSSSCRVLKNINHRSGDFEPSFYSLRLFLAILIYNEEHLPFRLPKVLTIKELDSKGRLKYKHRWRRSEMRAWVKTFEDDKELMSLLINQKKEAKLVHYLSTINEPLLETANN